MNTPGSVLYGWVAFIGAGIAALYFAKQDLISRRRIEAEKRALGQKDEMGKQSNPDVNASMASHSAPSFDKDMSFYDRLNHIESSKKYSNPPETGSASRRNQ
jgi:hypothetical protein